MSLIVALEQAIRVACPSIDGVSVRDPLDKSTWRIDFRPAASAQERAAAQAALAAFDIAAQDAAEQAEAGRLAAIDAANAGFAFGGQTLAQLKAMTNAQFDTWWAANVTNAAQAIAVLKLVARALLRRVL